MNEFLIKSSDNVEFNFNGDLIHQTQSSFPSDDHRNRRFTISVYAIDGGGFVSSIEYQSDCPHEKSVSWYEETDSFEDVEKFFYVFDVCELVTSASGLPRDQKEELQRINKNVAKKFEQLMYEFLEEAKLLAHDRGFVDRVKEPSKAGSIWGLFKTK